MAFNRGEWRFFTFKGKLNPSNKREAEALMPYELLVLDSLRRLGIRGNYIHTHNDLLRELEKRTGLKSDSEHLANAFVDPKTKQVGIVPETAKGRITTDVVRQVCRELYHPKFKQYAVVAYHRRKAPVQLGELGTLSEKVPLAARTGLLIQRLSRAPKKIVKRVSKP